MKWLMLCTTAMLMYGCCEIEPVIGPLGPTETGSKKVLVEEYTGVKCVNCPQGSAELEGLLALYPENLVVVSIHAGDFSTPYMASLYDFRTPDGDQLSGFLGLPEGYPAALVNRQIISPNTPTPLISVGTSLWANNISAESSENTEVLLEFTTNFDPISRLVIIESTAVPQATLAGDHRISVLITESNINDLQLTPSGIVDNYTHKHVLRDYISAYNGDPIGSSLAAAVPINSSFNYTLPEAWNAQNCEVVVFIHRDQPSDRRILQVQNHHITE
jgi:Outer membrane protein Omp28